MDGGVSVLFTGMLSPEALSNVWCVSGLFLMRGELLLSSLDKTTKTAYQ